MVELIRDRVFTGIVCCDIDPALGEPSGVLVFKWNEEQVLLSEILCCAPQAPLFGNRRGKTHWLVFMKESTP